MFATFSASPDSTSIQYEAEDPLHVKPRPKRHQVARACVWCRTYRIKCDSSYPCRNCKAKGRRCSADTGKDEVRTFPNAIKEIDRLKERIKELEGKIQNLHNKDSASADAEDGGLSSQEVKVSLPVNLDPWAQHGGNKKIYNWDVVSTRTANSSLTYGPSSSFYFIGQLALHLETTLQHQVPHIHSAYTPSSGSPTTTENDSSLGCPTRMNIPSQEQDLSRPQEEGLLDLYWHSHHTIFPILDENEFKAHYHALWDISRALRQSSALVDTVLALCMQYKAALPDANIKDRLLEHPNRVDATTAGRWWHRRGQHLLTDELEEPSIRTFQCHLLSIVWLSNAGLQNMAHSVMAAGLRIGIILGLHLEPTESLPSAQRDFRRRLWWSMYALEMKFAMELGRPLAVNFGQVACSLPNDKGSSCASANSAAMFNAQYVKLFCATRAVYVTFYRKCGEALGKTGQKSLYQNPHIVEECAEFLASKTGYLYTWAKQIPAQIKFKRHNPGKPYSIDCSRLDALASSDSTKARQCAILEILYHSLFMSLYRPFITFSTSSSPGCVTESHAISCVSHAMMITAMIHQLLAETHILDGWVEAFQWQWMATLSLIGYIIAYPRGRVAPTVRKSLDTALAIFEIQSSYLVGARTASTITCDLSSKADLLIARAEDSLQLGSTASMSTISTFPELCTGDSSELGVGLDSIADSGILPGLGEVDPGGFHPALASSSGFAFTSNPFTGLEDIGIDGSMFDFLDFAGLDEA